VTLAVSERTSCRNLNGLKAIVWYPRPLSDECLCQTNAWFYVNPNSPLAPSPLSKDEPRSGLDCSGEFKATPDIR
jgi:hypothetical protein